MAADFWGSQLGILDDNVVSKVIHPQNQKINGLYKPCPNGRLIVGFTTLLWI